MGWEHEIFALFDDLESQARVLWEDERDIELADRARAEYAQVTLASRLVASQGMLVDLDVEEVGRLSGVLAGVGREWCLLAVAGQDWLVPTRRLISIGGVARRSVAEVAWPAVNRLGIKSVLRRLAEAEQACVVHLVGGVRMEGVLGRVGADFVELGVTLGPRLLPFDALIAVTSRED